MKVHEKIKTGMDETRLLLLGAQILLGFQINGIFQERFSSLPDSSRWMAACAFMLMTITVGLLIAPAMRHRLVNEGEASRQFLESTTRFAAVALLPLAVSLSIDLYIAVEHIFGASLALAVATVFLCGALLTWHMAPFLIRKFDMEVPMPAETRMPIHAKVEQMLTEARVLLPGAQALLGFQLAIMFTTAFSELPTLSKTIHLLALCCISVAIVLLMAPAAFHRISFRGEDSEEFHQLGSRFIVNAAAPLALGLSCDLFVGGSKATDSLFAGACLGIGAFSLLIFLWFVQPLVLRARERTS